MNTNLNEESNRKAVVDRVFEHLAKPEVIAQMKARQKQIDDYFRELRKQMRPTHEQLHRPFTI